MKVEGIVIFDVVCVENAIDVLLLREIIFYFFIDEIVINNVIYFIDGNLSFFSLLFMLMF